MKEGRVVRPIQGGEARMVTGAQFHFKIINGWPVINLRDLSGPMFYGALSEHIGFLNGAQTLSELVSFGLNPKWWNRWVTKEKCADFGLSEGDLGSASYGAVWTRFPKRDGGVFNQITAVVEQIKRAPHLRTHRIVNWYPPETIGPKGTRKVVVAPCHGDIYITADPLTKELIVHHIQRSGDLPVGVVFNIIQYAGFGTMLAQTLGYTFVELVYTFNDVHIYDIQYPFVEELISREPFPFPTVTLKEGNGNLIDFRPKDFTLSEYQSHPKMNIPTPT
jgi:thymidylate synthase